MRKKYTELFTIILSVIIVVVVILSVVYFIFFTSDDFLDAIIYKSIAAITKFVVLPSVTLLMIFYFLGITKEVFTKEDKPFWGWAKIGMCVFILLFIPEAPPLSIRSMAFLAFSFLAFLKIEKGEKAYANAFLFYAVLFNPFIRIIFWILNKFAYSVISVSLLIWGISDLIHYRINNKK